MLTALERMHLEALLLKEQLGLGVATNENARLSGEHLLYRHLQQNGVIGSGRWKMTPADEPRFFQFSVHIGATEDTAGGTSLYRAHAMRTALAEAVERKIWLTETAHLRPGVAQPSTHVPSHAPRASAYAVANTTQERFGATIDTVPLHWSRAYSYTSRKNTYVPTQLVSGIFAKQHNEPKLRQPITTGLATAPTRLQSLLGGTLEVIERDAFMLTWYAGIPPTRISHESLMTDEPGLENILASCARYRLQVDFVRLFTDAPTYAIGAVVSDSAKLPPLTVGTAAGQHAGNAALKALLEALRARQNARAQHEKGTSEQGSRLRFWSHPGHANQANFLTSEKLEPLEKGTWDHEPAHQHFRRLIEWARSCNFDVLAFDLSAGAANIVGWHIHQVVIPQLQPLHQDERQKCICRTRIDSVLKSYGHVVQNITTAPHPFV